MEKHSGLADEQYCRRGGRIEHNNTDCTYTRNSDTPMVNISANRLQCYDMLQQDNISNYILTITQNGT
eukprot:9595730-Ditylum_brightwellii.AAC.1